MIIGQIEKDIDKIMIKVIKKKSLLSKKKKIISSGIIDSLKIIELVSNFEKKFKITFVNDDLKLKNLDTADFIKKIIFKKLKKKI